MLFILIQCWLYLLVQDPLNTPEYDPVFTAADEVIVFPLMCGSSVEVNLSDCVSVTSQGGDQVSGPTGVMASPDQSTIASSGHCVPAILTQ